MREGAEAEYVERIRLALNAAMYYRDMDPPTLAAAIDVGRETVYRWLRGSTVMSAAHASAVAAVLDAPSDLFIRPPASRERALVMMAAWDELRRADAQPGPSRP